MSLAERTREAAREAPFLIDALRAGVVNYTAAARFLDVDGDEDAVATALRRYADELSAYRRECRDARVTMQRGVGVVEDPATDGGDELLIAAGDVGVVPEGDATAIAATGDVTAADLGHACRHLAVADVEVRAAAAAAGRLTVVVDGADGVDALRAVESSLENAPGRAAIDEE